MAIQSSAIETNTTRVLTAARGWMLPGAIWLFVLADGLVTRNPYEFAAPFRAGLLALVFAVGLAALAVRRVALGPAMIGVGVLCAMLVSQAYHQPQQPGLELWVIFGLAYLWQRTIGREWSTDFRRAGLLLAVCAIWLWLGMNLNGLQRPPEGMWNPNVMAGVLAAFIPSSLKCQGVKRWVILATMIAAIVATGSRGGLLAAMCASLFMGGALNRLPRPAIIALPVLAVVGLVVLIALKPTQSFERLLFWKSASELFAASPVFGAGPGPMTIIVPWHSDPFIQAHNSLINVAAMTGWVGMAFLVFAVGLVNRWSFSNWQAATLMSIFVAGLFDDPFTWLPTILICALVLGGTHAARTVTT